MKVEERRRVYITLTEEERNILHKVSILIEDIYDNMNEEDRLAFIEEDSIINSLDYNEIKDIADLLFNMQENILEII